MKTISKLFPLLTVCPVFLMCELGFNSGVAAQGIADSREQKSFDQRYTITSTLEILKPVSVGAMNNDAQIAKVLKESDQTISVQITVDPLADQLSSLVPNKSWKSEYSRNPKLKKYLDPGLTTNWDSEMQSELYQMLGQAGIFPDQLSDVELVQKVSNWIFMSSEFQYQNHFISYSVDFPHGKARILPELQEDFNIWKTLNHFNTDEEALAAGIYGKTMFKNRKFGNCTFSATLQATVLKALGIPTRLVLMVPVIDWNDQPQWDLVRSNIHQLDIQRTILDGLGRTPVGGWGSHTFNEVYVGNKWIRLNYTKLGQTPADAYYFGLMLQVNRMADWSEAHLGQTWGIHAQVHKLVPLSSINPYRSLAIYDDQRFINSPNTPQQPPPIVPAPTGAPVPQTATVIRASMGAQIGNSCPKERLCIVLELAENFNLASLTSIQETYSQLNMNFELQAEGQAAKPLAYYGITAVNNNKNLGLIFSLEEGFMVPGIDYLLKSTASPSPGPLLWIIPEKISISR